MGQSTDKPSNGIKSRSLALTYTQVYNANNGKWELDQDTIHAILGYDLMHDDEQTGSATERIPPSDIPQNTRSQIKVMIEGFEQVVA